MQEFCSHMRAGIIAELMSQAGDMAKYIVNIIILICFVMRRKKPEISYVSTTYIRVELTPGGKGIRRTGYESH
jgi:ABC-type uncharacterized transport system permease subunit